MSETLDRRADQAAAIRRKLMEGRAEIPVFAEAVGRTDRTVQMWIAQGMPAERHGNAGIVVVDPAIEWIRTRNARRGQTPKRGRPRKTA